MRAFDRSLFKLFTLRFSSKSVQAPSCEKPKTTQRTLFLSFEINKLIPNNGIASEAYEKSRKLVCHVVNSNIAIDTLPTLQITVGVKALFEKIYDGKPVFTVISNNGEDVQYRCYN